MLDKENVILADFNVVSTDDLMSESGIQYAAYSLPHAIRVKIQTRAMKNAKRICLTSDGFGIVNFNSFFDFPPPGSEIKFRVMLTTSTSSTDG